MSDDPLAELRRLVAEAGRPHSPEPCPTCQMEERLAALSDLLLPAFEALAERPESEHDGGCSAGYSKLACKCSQGDRAAVFDRLRERLETEAAASERSE